MKPLFGMLAIVFILGLCACGKPDPDTPPTAAKPTRPPNVALIVLDTLRADRVEAVRDGVPVMPHLAGLARESLYYPKAVSPCSWTKPAMASVMTSLYGDVHGVHYGAKDTADGTMTSDRLPEEAETLAEYLGIQGYRSYGVQTNSNLQTDFGFAQGFEAQDYIYSGGAPANYVSDMALDGIKDTAAPFFVYAHYMDPHALYETHEGYTDQFPAVEGLTEDDHRNLKHFWDYFWDEVSAANGGERSNKTPELSDAGKEEVERRYDGECRFLDHHLKRFIQAVKEKDPNTVFIIIADHGEEFWEHDALGHGLTLYEEQLAVPLIIHGPGIAPERREVPVSTLGILPSLANYLGYHANPVWQGEDFVAATPDASDPIFSLTHGSQSNTKQRYFLESVVVGGKKFIDDYGRGTSGLYTVDAPESTTPNLLETEEGAAHAYRLALSGWRAENDRIRTELFGADYAPPGENVRAKNADETENTVEVIAISEEQQAELAALGYLDNLGDEPESATKTMPNIVYLVVDGVPTDAGPASMPGITRLRAQSWRDGNCTTQAESANALLTALTTGAGSGPSSFYESLGYKALFINEDGGIGCGDLFGNTCAVTVSTTDSEPQLITTYAIGELRGGVPAPVLAVVRYTIDPKSVPTAYRDALPDADTAATRYVDAELLRLSNYIDTNFGDTVLVIATRSVDNTTSFSIRLPRDVGGVIEGEVRIADVLPTIAQAMGADPLPAWDGKIIGGIVPGE